MFHGSALRVERANVGEKDLKDLDERFTFRKARISVLCELPYMNNGEEAPSNFVRDGYAVLRHLVPESVRCLVYGHVRMAVASGALSRGDHALPDTLCCGGDPFTESLLEMLLPRIESEAARRLYPTYSYLRFYKRGDALKRHRDRPACEVAVTLNLGYDAAEPWPVWVESAGAARSYGLQPGDGLLYKGIEITHWRESFQGEHCAQVFLNYVDQNGPYAEWKYYKRARLGTSPVAKRMMEKLASALVGTQSHSHEGTVH